MLYYINAYLQVFKYNKNKKCTNSNVWNKKVPQLSREEKNKGKHKQYLVFV